VFVLKVWIPFLALEMVGWWWVDNILITKDGYENLTTAIKDVGEMEKIINGSWSSYENREWMMTTELCNKHAARRRSSEVIPEYNSSSFIQQRRMLFVYY
jgi:hypothetical protein